MRAPEPTYATIGATMPAGPDWTFEQKYDGMRVIALVTTRDIQLVTRNGRDKAEQFPEADAAQGYGANRRERGPCASLARRVRHSSGWPNEPHATELERSA